jgi:CubicO group peptidase (beta-lactamase class C family)
MARAPKWLSLLILVQLAGSGIAAEPASVRAQRVESGLRPAIVLDELAAEPFHLSDRMNFYKVPGVSIAVIDQGEIAWARGYGAREAGTETPVTTDTLFQAASISKPVAAVVALRLVEQGTLQLDEDVNRYLRSWQLPQNELTAQQKVTLRLLLSHRAGLTDYAGFKDALPNQRRPTLREMLETGKWTPAPIRVGLKPGSRFAYSGGGYCLLEQLLEDVTGKPFPTLARELVLEPLQMASSSFDQAFTPERGSLAAVGHQWNGKKLPRDWNDYPATSAAGLWTTASDLARFAIELQKVRAGKGGSILSPATATRRSSPSRKQLPSSHLRPGDWASGSLGGPPHDFFMVAATLATNASYRRI